MVMLLTGITRIEELTGISVNQYLHFDIDLNHYDADNFRYSVGRNGEHWIGIHNGTNGVNGMLTGIKIHGDWWIEMGHWSEGHRPGDQTGTYISIVSDGFLTLGFAYIDYEHSRYGDITRKEKQYKTAPFRLALG